MGRDRGRFEKWPSLAMRLYFLYVVATTFSFTISGHSDWTLIATSYIEPVIHTFYVIANASSSSLSSDPV